MARKDSTKGASSDPSEATPPILLKVFRLFLEVCVRVMKFLFLMWCCLRAYRIRLFAVETFGYVIHEFDPWFNYRAAQYLYKNGWHSFFHWYDYMSWYPIGRPIGTTIYPGMQITAVAICRLLKLVPTMSFKIPLEVFRYLPSGTRQMLPGHGTLTVGSMSLNQVCCMVPAWFGAFATLLTFLLTAEVSGSSGAGLVAAFVMSTIPAHMMRSYAGEFDNECVAVSTFLWTFWLWCRAIRTARSWPFAILGGFVYTYAVATWGGYIFVINLIGLHAALLVALGKFNKGVYLSYTLFYAIGTIGATYVPVVGWAPLRSLETIAPLAVFCGYQVLQFCDIVRRRSPSLVASGWRFFRFRVVVFIVVGVVAGFACYFLNELNYFGPLTSRIRGLIIKHKKTGNPLVDSVAEHRPATADAYESRLHHARYVAVAGLALCWHQRQPSKFFPVLYAAVAFHFSLKMSRLMIICGPIVSILAGYPFGMLGDWCIEQVLGLVCEAAPPRKEEIPDKRSGGVGSIVRAVWPWLRGVVYPAEVRDIIDKKDAFRRRYAWLDGLLRIMIASGSLYLVNDYCRTPLKEFDEHCRAVAEAMSNPKIVFKINNREGKTEIISDYLDGYKWLRENTPKDSRVMAWWDYGYQITGVANRTSIADGNTWNHEHIATLGRTLTNPEKKAHNIMKHLADYVLVWAGGRSDDMAKSPHLARIANSIYPDTCGAKDPTCTKFGIDRSTGAPTRMMAESFLYRAVNHKLKQNVALDAKLFKEVHTTKYGLMRIFQVLDVNQTSKAWVADPRNRKCDAPGSWYCIGQYPEALGKLINKRRNFAQLEDFNKKGQVKSEYTRMVERQQLEGNNAEL